MKRIGILLIFTLLVTACGSSASPDAPPDPTSTTVTAATLPEALSEISMTDATGQNLVFPAPPERVTVAGKASQMIIHALYLFPEAVERVIAMEQRMQRNLSMLPLIDPNFDTKDQFERDAAAEQIAPVQPDVVLMKTYMADKLGSPLEQIGIPVAYMDLESPDQFFRDIEAIGAMFDNPERVEEIKSFYQVRLDELQDGVAGIDPGDLPDVLLLQYSDRSGEVAFNVPSASWLQTTMVSNAGGTPIWRDAAEGGGWTLVNFEQIAAWDPDVIILVNYTGDPGEVVQNLKEDSNWNALRATKDGELYAFPGDFLSWDQPDTRWILGQLWLAKVIHPDLFSEWDMLDQAREFYTELYKLDEATFETDVAPLINGDIEPSK
ncbi:MAG: ABC transporter substrate-binding protein [Anaerolineales bacterium]|jgi:iron complex transport system substrate-binding protein